MRSWGGRCWHDSNSQIGRVLRDSARQEAAEKLARLKAGDAVAIAGSAKLTSWEKDGETKHGLSVTASAVLSAYDVKRRRGNETKDKPGPPAVEAGFDDEIPF